MARAKAKGNTAGRPRLDARPDTLDFRDLMYTPTLAEVPLRIPLAGYRKVGVPVLDQGKEGACTGFGLATVVHYLLRTRKVDRDAVAVSPRMLYEMARRYDEWPGEDYEGSSARGAMKGWHKHGVCSEKAWPYDPAAPDDALTGERSCDAAARPLGAYFRVNHRDLVAMHTALAEVGVLYATASVHEGWWDPPADGLIPLSKKLTGGHAFAIVGYDESGLWIQNSWGPRWGKQGFGRVSYDDWMRNGSDVWVFAPYGARRRRRSRMRFSAAANSWPWTCVGKKFGP
ncbi:MAG TPA: C1 family peptidase, partial [Planctomycetota bacterium]|nr:C1 family peptidase [Planctomycetota bacterium]